MIKAIKTTRYVTTDGREHPTLEDARKRQLRINLNKLLEAGGVGSGGEWSSTMFGDWLEENFAEIKKLSSGRVSS